MAEDTKLSRSSVEILDNVANIVELLNPDIQQSLGEMALTGLSDEQRRRAESLMAAAARIAAIIEPTIRTIDDLLVPREEPVAAAHPQPEPFKVKEEKEERIGEEPVRAPFDKQKLNTIHERYAVSPNETTALTLAVDYLLSEQGSKVSIRRLIAAAFGRSRLRKGETERFQELLSAYADSGLISQYGTSFTYTGDIERQDREAEEKIDITEQDIGLVKLVQRLSRKEPGGLVNVGQIVRSFSGLVELPSERYWELVGVLNSLVKMGYLHHPETAWYTLGQRELIEVRPAHLRQIVTRAIEWSTLTPKGADLRQKATPEVSPKAELPSHELETRVAAELEQSTELDKIGQDILKYARRHPAFRMETLHAQVRSIGKLSPKDYAEFKLNFAQRRNEIIEHLKQQGIAASWQVEGQKRGQKYTLIIEKQSTPVLETLTGREQEMFGVVQASVGPSEWFQQKEIDFESFQFKSDSARNQAFFQLMKKLLAQGVVVAEGQRGGRKYRLVSPVATTEVSATEELAEKAPVAPQAKIEQALVTITQIDDRPKIEANPEVVIRFRNSLGHYVAHKITAAGGREKLATIRKDIAASLGITEQEASVAIDNLAARQIIYKNGTYRGARLLTVTPPTEEETQKNKGRESESNNEGMVWTDQSELSLRTVLDELAKMPGRHLQRGVDINKLYRGSSSLKAARITLDQFKRAVRAASSVGIIRVVGVDRTAGGGRSKRTSKMVAFVNIEQQSKLRADLAGSIEQVKTFVQG